jgi:hypothetical protein
MNAPLNLNLDIGDEVYLDGATNGVTSGHYMVMEIVSDSGDVENNGTVLVLDDKDGGVIEAYAKDIR